MSLMTNKTKIKVQKHNLPIKAYSKGARFEREIIHQLLEFQPICVMRGAGSKSYAELHADIIALFANPKKEVILQAKSFNTYDKQEEKEFLAICQRSGYMGWYVTPKNLGEVLLSVKEYLKRGNHERIEKI